MGHNETEKPYDASRDAGWKMRTGASAGGAAGALPAVVYDLFREFSQPTLKHRSLFCCLSSHEQIPERFTALLALKHPDVPLFAPHLLMKAFQQVRRPYERGERLGKIDRQVR